MKLAMLLILSLFSLKSNAFAGECVDISGLYNDGDLVLQIKQSGCHSLTILFGNLDSHGKPKIGRYGKVFSLDGTCDTLWPCNYASADQTQITVTEKDVVPVQDDIHGLCSGKTYALSKSAKGDVVKTFQSVVCDDGFTGPMTNKYLLIR